MFAFLVRRTFLGVITLLLVTFVIYGLIRSMPGSPIDNDLALLDPSKVIDQDEIDRLNKIYGLDKHWTLGYVDWVANLATGDLGRSYTHKRPVSGLIGERIGPTLLLSMSSLALTYILAIPMGLFSSARAGGKDERALSIVLYALYSFPSFVAALFLQLYFAVKLGWLPLQDMVSPSYDSMSSAAKAWDITIHALMPVVCYTYGSLAYYSRFIRANMQEVLRQDYIRTARAKGLDEKTVIVKHAFRNTLIPLVTLIGLTLPSLLSGSVIIEQIFNWPGMGKFFFESIRTRDYQVIMGLTLIFSVLTLLGQFLADVLYAVVDPRVRLE